MSLKDLKAQLKTLNFSKSYFLYGEEKYLLKAYEKMLKEKILPASDEFSYMEKEGKDLGDFSKAVAFKESFPFMSEKKILVIRDFNLQITKDTEENLKNLITDIPDYLVIMFVNSAVSSDEKNDKQAKLERIIKNCGGLCVEFVHAGAADLLVWIKRHFKSENKLIETDECNYLMEVCGTDMSVLENEIQKLCNISDITNITKAQIDKICVKSLNAKTYELTDALLRKNYAQSFLILDELFDMRMPDLIIASSIYKCFSDLYLTKLLKNSGQSVDIIAKKTGLMPFLAKKYSKFASEISLDDIRNCVKICSDCEREKKRSRGEEKLLMEKMIGEIISAGKKQVNF